MSADSAMKCTPQKTMYSASGPGGGVPGQLEGVAGDVGELDDLVALVVVAEHEDLVAERLLGRAGARSTRSGSDGGGQVAGALDAALAPRVGLAAEQQQGERAVELRAGRWSRPHPPFRRTDDIYDTRCLMSLYAGVSRCAWSVPGVCSRQPRVEHRSRTTSTSDRMQPGRRCNARSRPHDRCRCPYRRPPPRRRHHPDRRRRGEGQGPARAGRPDDLALRVAVQPGGCSGLRYQLFFDERPSTATSSRTSAASRSSPTG